MASDEVLHARLGWLSSNSYPHLPQEARDRTQAFLAPALLHLERCMLGAMPPEPPLPSPVRAHAHALGYTTSTEGRSLFYDTVEQIILPRLDALGFDASRSWSNRAQAQELLVS
ncbi:MAG: hypothetical protein AAFX99_30745 [Myxococcota bacterium]